jgi:hypothetical protein
MNNAKPLIFISHINEEAELAIAVKQELSRLFLDGVRFFVSPDRQSIDGGDHWLQEIKEAIAGASVVIVLVSRQSINRNWINFEAGAGWLAKRVVPLCHSGLRPAELPQPMQSLRGFDIDDDRDMQSLCELVGEAAGLTTPRKASGRLAATLRKSAHKIGQLVAPPAGAAACWVFPSSESPPTIGAMTESLQRCKVARFCSLGLNFLWSASRLQTLAERVANRECEAHILMANFASEDIQRRLAEEPGHPIGGSGGEHLIRQLVALEKKVGDTTRFSIRLFSHKPTYAMLLFDDEAYVYVYGFETLGNLSPAFYVIGGPAFRFFTQQFDRISGTSIPAATMHL